MKYLGPFWIFIGEATGMPSKIEKCSFKPTIHPAGFSSGDWHEAYLETREVREAKDRLIASLQAEVDLARERLGPAGWKMLEELKKWREARDKMAKCIEDLREYWSNTHV